MEALGKVHTDRKCCVIVFHFTSFIVVLGVLIWGSVLTPNPWLNPEGIVKLQ